MLLHVDEFVDVGHNGGTLLIFRDNKERVLVEIFVVGVGFDSIQTFLGEFKDIAFFEFCWFKSPS